MNEYIRSLEETGKFKVLRRVPEQFDAIEKQEGKCFQLAVIDLETTGLDSSVDEIIEIGLLIAEFTNESGITKILSTDNQLQEPKIPISAEITKITGITNEDVKGKSIKWKDVKSSLANVDLVICHNASFDRNFLELQTPKDFQELIKSKAFACSSKDVPWADLGFEGKKLEYLNFKMGYFYDGHRALVDCWATLNLFVQHPSAFDFLKNSARMKETLLCAINAPFEKKDELKARGYSWSDGTGNLPKCWWTTVPIQDYEGEVAFLTAEIYKRKVNLPTGNITAKNRYSQRALCLQ